MSLEGFEKELCHTLCEKLSFRKVPIGAAIGTPFIKADGDKVGFYLVETEGGYRIEDDGDTIPTLEAMGVDFSNGPRAEALDDMLMSYGVTYDESDFVIRSPTFNRENLAREALQFAGLILRLQDFILLTREGGFPEGCVATMTGEEDQKRDEVLKRLLETPPKPKKKEKPDELSSKRNGKTEQCPPGKS